MSKPREDTLLFNIGWMSAAFAQLESRVVDCLARLVNTENPRIGELIADRLSLHQTVSLIGALLKDSQDVEVCTEFASLSKEVEKAAGARNDILHSSWATPSGEDVIECDIIQQRARKRHMLPIEHNLDDLLSRIEEDVFFIQQVEMKIFAFGQRHPKRNSQLLGGGGSKEPAEQP